MQEDKKLYICNKNLLSSYGLTGNENAKKVFHKFCPKIKMNCCTPTDQDISMHLWNTKLKKNIQTKYTVYLDSLKYVLGFYDEYMKLAQDLKISSNNYCKTVGMKFHDQYFDKVLLSEIYDVISKKQDQIADIRKGFFCIICDGETSQQTTELKYQYTHQQQFKNKQLRMLYSQQFCQTLVQDSVKANYYEVHYVKKFLSEITSVINCKANNSTKLEMELPLKTQQHIKNCFFFRDQFFFFFCEKYCENFNISKYSPVFDGRIEDLKDFVKHVSTYRRELFYAPRNNFFLADALGTERYLLQTFDISLDNEVLIPASSNQIQLENYKSDFLNQGGFDPMNSVQNALYTIELK
jgi:hypothetical protein